MFVVAGLGNPDNKYKNTLHNLGFMAVDILADKLGVSFDKKGHKGIYATATVGKEKVIILKPLTYMNLSGESIQSIMSFYKLPPENLLVIYDDLDINVGAIRIRPKGSSGTHNGMRNIVKLLGSENFPRIRVGSKPVNFQGDIIDYVLSSIKKEDEALYQSALEKAANAALSFCKGVAIDRVMNEFNG